MAQLITSNYSQVAGNKGRLEQRMLAQLNPQPNEFILDAGCGDGRLSKRILDLCPTAHVDGIEIDPALARQATDKGLNVEVLPVQNVWQQQERYGRYDKVFCNLVLNWLKENSDFSAAIFGFNQVLKPGGKLIAVFPLQLNPQIRQELRDALLPHLEAALSEQEWRQLCGPSSSCQFQSVSTDSVAACDQLVKEVIPIRHSTKYEVLSCFKDHGFFVHETEIVHRKSPLPNGLKPWLEAFIMPHVFERLPQLAVKRDQIMEDMMRGLSNPNLGLYRDGEWSIVADMLHVSAVKVPQS